MKTLLYLAALIALIACGPQGPRGYQGQEGPQGEQGPTGATGEDGADGADGEDGSQGATGNANVTQYIFPGNDYAVDPWETDDFIPDVTEAEFYETVWLVYLVHEEGIIYPMPGRGYDGLSEYDAFFYYDAEHGGVGI